MDEMRDTKKPVPINKIAGIQAFTSINPPWVGDPPSPLNVKLSDNGNSTFTHLPRSGSSALDSGQCAASIATDQRGVGRLQGGICDRSSVEHQPNDTEMFTIYLPQLTR
jgi:hypothetical protein